MMIADSFATPAGFSGNLLSAEVMKIFKFTLENMCGMKSGVIYANGANVYISGQNGTRKYYDGTTGEVNELDANGDYIRDDKTHVIEMEIDDGEILRREFVNQFIKNYRYI